MPQPDLTIKAYRAENGWRVEVVEPEEVADVVYQEPENGEGEVEAFAAFLWALEQHIGPATSRYSPERIYILVRPGDKHPSAENSDAWPPLPVCNK